MENLKINIYDENDNVVKTSEAKIIDLRYGTVRSLMELLNVEDIDNTAELLRTVYRAWNQITAILGKVFPDLVDSDWDNVKLSELLPVLVVILKSSFAQLLTIPNDSKNSIAE
jgi:hypothetical protein